jgi:hypothetical protein
MQQQQHRENLQQDTDKTHSYYTGPGVIIATATASRNWCSSSQCYSVTTRHAKRYYGETRFKNKCTGLCKKYCELSKVACIIIQKPMPVSKNRIATAFLFIHAGGALMIIYISPAPTNKQYLSFCVNTVTTNATR